MQEIVFLCWNILSRYFARQVQQIDPGLLPKASCLSLLISFLLTIAPLPWLYLSLSHSATFGQHRFTSGALRVNYQHLQWRTDLPFLNYQQSSQFWAVSLPPKKTPSTPIPLENSIPHSSTSLPIPLFKAESHTANPSVIYSTLHLQTANPSVSIPFFKIASHTANLSVVYSTLCPTQPTPLSIPLFETAPHTANPLCAPSILQNSILHSQPPLCLFQSSKQHPTQPTPSVSIPLFKTASYIANPLCVYSSLKNSILHSQPPLCLFHSSK